MLKEKIRWGISIIKSGYSFKDKLILVLYCVMFPLKRIGLDKKLAANVTVMNQDGIFYCSNDFGNAATTHPAFEWAFRRIFKEIKEGIFIDVGANIGKYVISVGKRIKGKVIAIEPESKNFNILKKNIRLNHLDNIVLINLACSSRTGRRKFFLDKISSGANSFYKTKVESDKFVYIKTNKLDNIINKNLTKKEIKKISLIKIDVEGAEADVLKGAIKILKKYHPKLLIEAWDKDRLKKIEEILLPLGYSEKRLDKMNYLFSKIL